MQALKTIADSAYSAARSQPNAVVKTGNAYVCGSDVLYVASDDRIACLEVSPPSAQGAGPRSCPGCVAPKRLQIP